MGGAAQWMLRRTPARATASAWSACSEASIWRHEARPPSCSTAVCTSAAVAREFTDSHHVPADMRELVANAIAMHHTPGVGLESGAEAYLLSAGAGVDVFGLRSNEIPDAVRQSVIVIHDPADGIGFDLGVSGQLRSNRARQIEDPVVEKASAVLISAPSSSAGTRATCNLANFQAEAMALVNAQRASGASAKRLRISSNTPT